MVDDSSSTGQPALSPNPETLTALSSGHVSRMIHSRHYVSPSRPIYSDRFIPSRSGSNLALFHIPSPSPDPECGGGKEEGSSRAYETMLRAAMFGPESPGRRNILRYKSETRQSLFPLSPFPFEEVGPRVCHVPVKAPRWVARTPYRILDAPELENNFYFNLLDWSSQNVLAVGLGNTVYLWNESSSKATMLCDLGMDDSVCSVGWSHGGAHLSVGTKNGKVQIWDASQCKRIRTMQGHQHRVGVLAWSKSLLSSGSRDKSILQRDIRAQDDFVSKLSGHKSEVCGLKWSDDNRKLASGEEDCRLFVWNQHSTQPVLKNFEHAAAVKAIAWSPHLHGLLASGGGTEDRCIRVWNTTTNAQLNCIDTGSQVCNLGWSKNVNELVSTHGHSKNRIVVWRYPTMSKLATLTGHSDRVLYLAISPDGRKIVTGSGDETLQFWNLFPVLKSQKMKSDFGASSLGRTTIR